MVGVVSERCAVKLGHRWHFARSAIRPFARMLRLRWCRTSAGGRRVPADGCEDRSSPALARHVGLQETIACPACNFPLRTCSSRTVTSCSRSLFAFPTREARQRTSRSLTRGRIASARKHWGSSTKDSLTACTATRPRMGERLVLL